MHIEINSQNFEEVVVNSDKPVLVDFWAPWCGPCRMMGPIVDEIGDEYKDKIVVGKINVDDEMDLAQQYRVTSIPAFCLFEKGELKTKVVGGRTKEDLLTELEIK